MSELSFRWFALIVDVSLKVCLLAAAAGLGLRAARVRNSNARHATWFGVLLGILALPLLAVILPGIAFPLPGRFDLLMQNARKSTRPVERVSVPIATPIVANNSPTRANAGADRQANRIRIEPPADVVRDRMPTRDAFPEASAGSSSPRGGGYMSKSEIKTAIAAVESKEIADSSPAAPKSSGVMPIHWFLVLAAIWGTGVLIFAIRLTLGIVVTRGLVRRSKPARMPSPIEIVRENAAGDIRESSEVVVPVTVGLFRSRVLLPRAWKTWPSEKLGDVLAHERAHVLRRDCLTAFLADLGVAVYWFHPVAWWLRERLAFLAEEACDDAAVSATGNRTAYARHLLEIVSALSGRSGRLIAPDVSMARQSNVETRINAILDFNRPLSCRLNRTVTLFIAIVLVPFVGIAAALRPTYASEQEARTLAPVAARVSSVSVAEQSADRTNNNPVVKVSEADPPRSSELPASSDPQGSPPSATSGDEELLTVIGRVFGADGSPAAGALVTVVGTSDARGPTALADDGGHFRLSNAFGTRCYLQARTADWRQQVTHPISPAAARVTLRQALELKMSPAHEQYVFVTAAGKPAGGVRVIASGRSPFVQPRVNRFVVEGRSGPDGRATLWVPAGEHVTDIDAWDPKLGGVGAQLYANNSNERPEALLKLALPAPNPQTIRIVDQNARPVPNFRFWIGCRGNNSFSTAQFEEAAVQTDSRGEVTVPWMPSDNAFTWPARLSHSWTLDDIRMASSKDRGLTTTIQVRRLRPVTGRLAMPSGATAAGIAVSGSGCSIGNGTYFDSPTARARRDGTFTILAASDRVYFFDIQDTEWSSDRWAGVVLSSEVAQPAAIVLNAERGVPLTVAVTKGPKSEPCAGVEVKAEDRQGKTWTDTRGRSHGWRGAGQFYVDTDANGLAHFAVRREKYYLDCSIGNWDTGQIVQLDAGAPVFVTLHRPWPEERPIFGQMQYLSGPRTDMSTTTLRAWSVGGTPLPVEIYPGGWFTLAAHPEHFWLYAKDAKKTLNAYHDCGPTDWRLNIRLSFEPTGVYSGTVVDESGKPFADCRVRLIHHPPRSPLSADGVVLDEVGCDEQGRFQFESAPTDVPLLPVVVKPVANGPARVLPTVLRELHLASHETFLGDRVVVASEEPKSAALASKQPRKQSTPDRLPGLLRDARLSHMKVLVVVEGDATKHVQEATHKLLENEEQFPEILHYLPLVIRAQDVPSEVPLFARVNVRPPESGEILLLVANAEGRGFQEHIVRVDGVSSGLNSAIEFLKNHAPATRDARKLLAAALEEAKATSRSVWVTEAAPRCEPCFQLARWMDDQRTLLGYDYVCVQLLAGCDRNVEEVMRSLNRPKEAGPPWFAIVGWRGNVLATSDGPRGNIGYPDTLAAKRHLRQAIDRTAGTMTAAEIDRLIKSLGD